MPTIFEDIWFQTIKELGIKTYETRDKHLKPSLDKVKSVIMNHVLPKAVSKSIIHFIVKVYVFQLTLAMITSLQMIVMLHTKKNTLTWIQVKVGNYLNN